MTTLFLEICYVQTERLGSRCCHGHHDGKRTTARGLAKRQSQRLISEKIIYGAHRRRAGGRVARKAPCTISWTRITTRNFLNDAQTSRKRSVSRGSCHRGFTDKFELRNRRGTLRFRRDRSPMWKVTAHTRCFGRIRARRWVGNHERGVFFGNPA